VRAEALVYLRDAPDAQRLLDDEVPECREFGLACALRWLDSADEVLVVGPPSEGMAGEIRHAEAWRIPVRRVGIAEVLAGGA
jgi:hypothetical protein